MATFTLYKHNKISEKYEMEYEEILQQFRESEQYEAWHQGRMPLRRALADFLTANEPDGLQSSFDGLDELVKLENWMALKLMSDESKALQKKMRED